MAVGLSLLIGVLVAFTLVLFASRRWRVVRPRLLRRVGFALTAVLGGIFAVFLVGDTLSDPGGWAGAGLVAAWAIPLVAVGLLAWLRPRATTVVSVLLAVAVISLSIWSALDPSGWGRFENHHGPIRAVAVFAVAVVLALWGLHRTLGAGILLLVTGLVPMVLSAAGRHGLVSLAAASAAPVLTGLLYVASAFTERRTSHHSRGASG